MLTRLRLQQLIRIRLLRWFFLGALMIGGPAFAAAPLSTEPAETFFTNVAARLLVQQLGVEWTQIQIAPTNQYDRAVHRLFQVTANLYDATSTNIYPSVFRPLFATNGGTVILAGFTNDHRLSTLGAWLESNPYGLPMVIAAKKGFPNFNEFTLRSDILMTRKLQLTRPSTALGTQPNGTNQMYVLSISNYFGVESWNSYDVARSGPYPRPLTVVVSNFARVSMTNRLGLQTNGVQAATATSQITNWEGGLGFSTAERTNVFRLTLNTNQIFLSNAVYVFSGSFANTFANLNTNAFENLGNAFPLPDWTLTISNRLAYWMFEPGLDRILDFVLLEDSHAVDLHRDLIAGVNPYAAFGASPNISGLWSTNRQNAGSPTEGVRRQIDISRGAFAISAGDWRQYAQAAVGNENDKQSAINGFAYFLGLTPPYPGVAFTTNASLAMETPFNPAAKLAALRTWQVNDPLVHYHRDELRIGMTTNLQYLRPAQPAANFEPSTLTNLNNRYAPWNGNPQMGTYPEPGDRSVKDAGVTSSDHWNFPTNETLAAHWIGRVHRGTPWQTIYLQADIASVNEWAKQSDDAVFVPGLGMVSRTHPTNDWRLAARWASLVSTNQPRDLLSVNDTNFAHWQATLTGLTVLSNNLDFAVFGDPTQFQTNVITPDAPQISTIVAGMQQRRAGQRGGYFADVAAWLSVPELSSASPWLNMSSWDQTSFGLTDEAYEALPSQLLSLVRADAVVTAAPLGNSVELQFTAFDGYAFRVESSTNLTNWTTFSEPHFTTNGVLTLMVPTANGQRYFRAVLP